MWVRFRNIHTGGAARKISFTRTGLDKNTGRAGLESNTGRAGLNHNITGSVVPESSRGLVSKNYLEKVRRGVNIDVGGSKLKNGLIIEEDVAGVENERNDEVGVGGVVSSELQNIVGAIDTWLVGEVHTDTHMSVLMPYFR